MIPLKNTSGQPPLASLQDRALRERIMQASLNRASKGGEFDNRAVVASMVKLRAERAALLGYANHAAYVLADETAGSVGRGQQAARPDWRRRRSPTRAPRRPTSRRSSTRKAASSRFRQPTGPTTPRRCASRSSISTPSNCVPISRWTTCCANGVFFAANKLYGLSFKERKDLPVYLPDIRVFEVFNEDGSHLALFLVDYYARSNKRGGAWANAYVAQSSLLGTSTGHRQSPEHPEAARRRADPDDL